MAVLLRFGIIWQSNQLGNKTLEDTFLCFDGNHHTNNIIQTWTNLDYLTDLPSHG
jgi:hypothetical protein